MVLGTAAAYVRNSTSIIADKAMANAWNCQRSDHRHQCAPVVTPNTGGSGEADQRGKEYVAKISPLSFCDVSSTRRLMSSIPLRRLGVSRLARAD